MVHLMGEAVCFAAVVLPCAEGHLFGRFGRKPHPESPSTLSKMSLSAVEDQLAVQKGSCHDAWAEGLSSQCPEGAVMALKGYDTILGPAMSVPRCEPAGCLHSHGQEGGGGGNALHKNDTLKEAVEKEVAMLAEQQPGVSFEKHLTARSKNYKKEGSHLKGTLAMLLREAPTDRRETATTMRFFAEMATYQGFVGSEVDETWASLNRIHKEYMVLELARRGSQLMVARFGDAAAKGVTEVNIAAKLIEFQKRTIVGVRVELFQVLKLLDEAHAANDAMAVATEKLRTDIVEVRDKARADLQAAANGTAVSRSGRPAAIGRGEKAAAQSTDLSSQLEAVRKQLEKERDAKKAEVEALRDDIVTFEQQAGTAQQAAEQKEADLNSELFAVIAEERKSAKQSLALMTTLARVEERLGEERKAKALAVTEVEEMDAIITEVGTNLKQAYKNNAKLVAEMAESKTASSNICDKMLEEKEAIIALLEESCGVELASEGTKQGQFLECPLQLEEAMRGWEACTTKTEDLVDEWESAVEEVKSLSRSVMSLGQEGKAFREAAGKCSASLKQERLAHQQHLASLDISDNACDCPDKEVPAIDGAGNASEAGASTPHAG